jgi:hypothetical protein
MSLKFEFEKYRIFQKVGSSCFPAVAERLVLLYKLGREGGYKDQ